MLVRGWLVSSTSPPAQQPPICFLPFFPLRSPPPPSALRPPPATLQSPHPAAIAHRPSPIVPPAPVWPCLALSPSSSSCLHTAPITLRPSPSLLLAVPARADCPGDYLDLQLSQTDPPVSRVPACLLPSASCFLPPASCLRLLCARSFVDVLRLWLAVDAPCA